MFTKTKNFKNVQFRIFVINRFEISIRLEFRVISEFIYENFVFHKISAIVIRHDIIIFLKYELNKIKKKNLFSFDWFDKQKFKLFIKKSNNLFIYVIIVCRFIKNRKWYSKKRLNVVFQKNDDSQKFTQRFDNIYIQILRIFVIEDCNEKKMNILIRRFRNIMKLIIVLFDSLFTIVLIRLSSILSKTINIILNFFKSMLNVSEDRNVLIQFFHSFFRDFFVNKKRCFNKHFWIDQKKIYHNIIEQCLCVISKILKKNIC